MSEGTGHRSLADQLRQWSDDRLAALLTARPDLASPAPRDCSQLASRAAVRSSIARALDGLNRGELFVLDAVTVARTTTAAELRSLVAAAPDFVDAALARLVQLAVVWESPEGLRALSMVTDCLAGGEDGGVSGLHPRSTRDPGAAVVADRLAALSPAARGLLEHVVGEGGTATAGRARRNVRPAAAESPAEELLAHDLLVADGEELLVVPGEVGMSLRGGTTTTAPVDVPPDLATDDTNARLAANVAVAAATEFVRRAGVLLETWSHRPPAALRSGGLGVRDLRAAATHLGVTEAEAALVVEVVVAAGLAASRADGEGNPVWVPTDAFDTWAAAPVADQWSRLVHAWWTTSRVPALVGERDEDGRARNALLPDLASATVAETRAMALSELADLPDGVGLAAGTGGNSLLERLRWQRPRRPRGRADEVAWTLQEAEALGLLGRGVLSSQGRALVAGEDVGAALTDQLPPPVTEVVIQADLTAVAPGPLAPDVAPALQVLADVESRGGATVYRFTAASVRRALDEGWSAAEIHDFLDSVSATPVPQPLRYLVDDATRTFGRLRVGHADAFIRSDDEAALVELVHHPQADALGLRRIAPTVVISTTPVDVLLPRLRDLGLAPVVEAPDGTLRVGRVEALRARTPRDRAPGSARAREASRVAAAVRAVRAGEVAARTEPARAVTPGGALSALRDAVERGSTVVIDFTDHQGVIGERVVEPERVEGGQLTAYDRAADDTRSFAVHRIRSVRPAE
ncbi:helicase-associated domain-containing protein [Nocardioides panacisoli]|uniref:helicase-associated domain-containing protein n=1 Tax=Nocardioides panacisoli TaxID=627624 RepID=UPI001C62CC55|nr:helicase-associated domain-containing protein [Nocardioides panacisoli]QYJ02673.1 helicase-associated domain-containing protein [Nocardioides panacisoli]